MSTDLQQDAQAILSDPTFDVEGFVTNINIHYQNKKIVKALGKSAAIVMSLIESGDYKFLEIMPDFIDTAIFKEMHEEEYEVWHKCNKSKSKYSLDSDWYGVKVNDKLAINFRRLGHYRKHSNSFEVISGEAAVKKVVSKWKRLKLLPIGEKHATKTLPVYKIRNSLRSLLPKLGAKSGYSYKNESSEFYYYKSRGNSYNYRSLSLTFQLLQSGKDNVRVKVKCAPKEALVKHKGKVKTLWNRQEVSFSKKFPTNDPNLLIKIIDWATKATKSNKEYRDNNAKFDSSIVAGVKSCQ